MTIIEDVGQKIGQHTNISDYCKAAGIILRRQKLNVGDYIVAPKISVDTKQGMSEVYGNLVQDHDRFRAECIRAHEDGTQLIILIENTDGQTCLDDVERWQNPRVDEYYSKYSFALAARKHGKPLRIPSPPVPNKRLIRMMETMTDRYGVRWMFCRPDQTGEMIVQLLTGGG